MRIVGLDEFLLLPAGTVFAKYSPQIFGELCVKGDSIHESRDFLYRPLWEPYAENSGALCDSLTAAEERGAEVEIDTDCWQRDGLYEYGQLFAVFSREEVLRIAASLSSAAFDGYRHPSPTLTDAEREAVEVAAEAYSDDHGERFAATLRGLLERLK